MNCKIWIQTCNDSHPIPCVSGKCILHQLYPDQKCFSTFINVHPHTKPDRVTLTLIKNHTNENETNKDQSLNPEVVHLSHGRSCPAFHHPITPLVSSPAPKFHGSISQPQSPIQLASAVLLISSDQKVLITQRASHLRTFPNYWVVPGGKVDAEDNSLEIAALREVHEETGIHINQIDDLQQDLTLICFFESCYPIHPKDGMVKRQILVAYYCAFLHQTANQMVDRMMLEAGGEVSQMTWIGIHELVNMHLPLIEQVIKDNLKATFDKHSCLKSRQVKTFQMNQQMKNNITPAAEDIANIARYFTKGTESAIAEWLRKYYKTILAKFSKFSKT